MEAGRFCICLARVRVCTAPPSFLKMFSLGNIALFYTKTIVLCLFRGIHETFFIAHTIGTCVGQYDKYLGHTDKDLGRNVK